MNLEQLQQFQQKPEPFTPGEPLFWDDPYLSSQMLATHLDPNTDLASRRPEIIDRSAAWLVDALGLQPGDSVLDLGFGPGLYASRLAQRGLQVTGVDYSRRSIEYATQYAQQHGLAIQYRYQDYLTLDDREQYDAALLIYGDFCPLSPEQRTRLLHNVHRALKPGGRFVLDVTTRVLRERIGMTNGWYVADGGFWRPGLHLVLEKGFDYPEQAIYLEQAIVIGEDESPAVYRMWFQDYSLGSITRELEQGGFQVESAWNDLAGTPYEEGGDWIGIVARRSIPEK